MLIIPGHQNKHTWQYHMISTSSSKSLTGFDLNPRSRSLLVSASCFDLQATFFHFCDFLSPPQIFGNMSMTLPGAVYSNTMPWLLHHKQGGCKSGLE